MTEIKEIFVIPPKVYEGVTRVMVRVPRYEATMIMGFLAACKAAKMAPARLAEDALVNGHGYQLVTEQSFQAPFEKLVSESNYKVYPNAIIAYGLEDSAVRLLDSDSMERGGKELVQSSRALVFQNETEGKVLDTLIIFFDDQPPASTRVERGEALSENKPAPGSDESQIQPQAQNIVNDVTDAERDKWILNAPVNLQDRNN